MKEVPWDFNRGIQETIICPRRAGLWILQWETRADKKWFKYNFVSESWPGEFQIFIITLTWTFPLLNSSYHPFCCFWNKNSHSIVALKQLLVFHSLRKAWGNAQFLLTFFIFLWFSTFFSCFCFLVEGRIWCTIHLSIGTMRLKL